MKTLGEYVTAPSTPASFHTALLRETSDIRADRRLGV
jgi:hypothetical protein